MLCEERNMRRDEEGQMEWSGAGQGRANTEREREHTKHRQESIYDRNRKSSPSRRSCDYRTAPVLVMLQNFDQFHSGFLPEVSPNLPIKLIWH